MSKVILWMCFNQFNEIWVHYSRCICGPNKVQVIIVIDSLVKYMLLYLWQQPLHISGIGYPVLTSRKCCSLNNATGYIVLRRGWLGDKVTTSVFGVHILLLAHLSIVLHVSFCRPVIVFLKIPWTDFLLSKIKSLL